MNVSFATPRDRFTLAVVLALALHAAVILGVRFGADRAPPPGGSIEVTLTRHSETLAPDQADFIAATNQQGSGSADTVLETTTRREAEFNAPEPVDTATAPPPRDASQVEARTVIAAAADAEDQSPLEAREIVEPEPAPATTHDFSFDSLVREIASLEARIAEEQQAQANRPRVKRLTSVSARSATEAGYLNAWRQRVERVGNANYPGGGIHGSLRMLVILRFDGALEEVRILESSGHKSLDDAALRIVRLAAPYPAFPVEMRKHYDQLEIIRTWQFSRTGTRLDS